MTAPWFERAPQLYTELETMLRNRYPSLHAFVENGKVHVRGTFPLDEGGRTFDRYRIDIVLADVHPAQPPRVWETGGRIPRTPDRHVFVDGALCLGTPLALWIGLEGDFSLPRFLDEPVRNFLIGNSLVEQGEAWPHGERAHGAAGMIEHLAELFGTQQPVMLATFLQAVAAGSVSKHSHCPCASSRKILKCHLAGFKALRRIPPEVLDQTARMILTEFAPERLAA